MNVDKINVPTLIYVIDYDCNLSMIFSAYEVIRKKESDNLSRLEQKHLGKRRTTSSRYKLATFASRFLLQKNPNSHHTCISVHVKKSIIQKNHKHLICLYYTCVSLEQQKS